MEPIPFSPPDAPSSVSRRLPRGVPAEESPALRLAEVMRLRWQSGERPLAEEILAQSPGLWQQPDAALDLIYEEICLREQFGLDAGPEQFYQRFPQWRSALALLFDCHRLIEHDLKPPRFPEVGEQYGDFRLVAELGRGGKGRVFLATESSLGDRPVVLKLTPTDGREHLSLARLQHTHIVPLHASSIDPERRVRLLCMPYFGGATLLQIRQILAQRPDPPRDGHALIEALDAVQARTPLSIDGREPTRRLLAQLSYVKAVCYLGACLGDALHYAHERGLLHLDVKPSNVLLSADAEPMLLDFHLAHEPLPAGAMPVEAIGGTRDHMAPEQREAFQAVEEGVPLPSPLDRRADVFALGLLLYELLGGRAPFEPKQSPPLHRINPQVGRGLSDLITRSLQARPDDRQATAGELAEDLRRHLHDLPLVSVSNRSGAERWHKWRRRHPAALRSWVLAAAVLFMTLAAGVAVWLYVQHHLDEGEEALLEGRKKAEARHHEEAIALFERGLQHLKRLPFPVQTADLLRAELRRAEQAEAEDRRKSLRADLHRLADRLRGLHGVEQSPSVAATLEERCRSFWDTRAALVEGLAIREDVDARQDFLDVALLWADFLAEQARQGPSRALQVLAEAEALVGPHRLIDFERQRFRAVAQPVLAGEPASAWEHRLLARAYLRRGELHRAEQHLEQALSLQLNDRWSHFLLGVCNYRLQRYQDAVTAFTFCLGAAPEDAVCSFNRGLAYHALKQHARALADYNRALRLAPSLGAAWHNRGLLHYQEKRPAQARADFQRALDLGSPPAPLHLNLALVALAEQDRPAAATHLRRVLQIEPGNPDARRMLDQLETPR